MATIVLCCTIPETFVFSTKIIEDLKKEGHKVIIMSSNPELLKSKANSLDVDFKHIPFYRGINPLKYVGSIRKITKELRRLKPDILIGATPKAAMVSMIGGKLAGVKNRIYHIYGLPFETAKGLKLKLLLAIERLTGFFATNIIPIGTSVKESTLKRKLFNPNKIRQKGLLTVGGVDINRFDPVKLKDKGFQIREELDIKNDEIVIGYVARYTYDKGFFDLIDLWQTLKQNPKIHLLLAGSMDEREPLTLEIIDPFLQDNRVHNVGFKSDIEEIFAAMDIFLFPSYREGFGNVSIEASSMGIPVITYDVTGCKDAVENDTTGYTVAFKDYNEIIEKVNNLIYDKKLRYELGEQGKKRVKDHFTLEQVSLNFRQLINEFINTKSVH